MNHMNHAAKMAAQDPAFPDYDDRGWPLDLVGLVLNVREDVVRLLELARALRSTNALRAQEIASIANSLQNAALSRRIGTCPTTAGPAWACR
jgi:hypothetical protein